MPNKQNLATQGEAAEFLGVPERTLSQWRYLRKGPRWSKIGRYARYRWEDLHSFVEENTKEAA